MLRVTRRISTAAQHYRFQLILISTDVVSLLHEAGSFLCKLQPRERKSERGILGNCEMDDVHRSSQIIYSIVSNSFALYFVF